MLAPTDDTDSILVSAIRLQNVHGFSDIDKTSYVCKVLTRIILKIFFSKRQSERKSSTNIAEIMAYKRKFLLI